MGADVINRHSRDAHKGSHHPSSLHKSQSYIFDLYKQTEIENLPEDWKDHMIKLLIEIHETAMPEEVKIRTLALLGEMLENDLYDF